MKAGENVWVMGWARIPGQSNGATLLRMPASVSGIDAETSELLLYMRAFEGLSARNLLYSIKDVERAQSQRRHALDQALRA